MKIEDIAAVCHEANRKYCEVLGDFSQSTWEVAEDWQKKSAINGVEFRVGNPDSPPSSSHDSWLSEKIADGWEYGEVKSARLKTHPCVLPFNELPTEQKIKDILFCNIVDILKYLL